MDRVAERLQQVLGRPVKKVDDTVGAEAKAAANWLSNEYFGRLNRAGLTVATGPIGAAANASIVQMVAANEITGRIAKDLIDMLWSTPGDPRKIVEERGLKLVTDTRAVERAIDAVIAANPDKVREAVVKPKLAAWFIGQTMKATGGKADPRVVNEMVRARLGLTDEG